MISLLSSSILTFVAATPASFIGATKLITICFKEEDTYGSVKVMPFFSLASLYQSLALGS